MENEAYNQVLNKESPLKEWIVNYVGETEKPENDEVTVEMVVQTMVREFPEIVLALAEENFIRGYEQAFTDMSAVTEDMIQKQKEIANEE
jgi:hypothetical protein